MIFKNQKFDRNKVKPLGKKRKLFFSIILSLRLVFGTPSSASANSTNFQTQKNHQTEISKVLKEEVSNDLEDTLEDTKVIIDSSSKQITIILPRGGSNSKSGPGARAKADAK